MYESVCHFDYATDLDKAIAYRDAEVPFSSTTCRPDRRGDGVTRPLKKTEATTKYK